MFRVPHRERNRPHDQIHLPDREVDPGQLEAVFRKSICNPTFRKRMLADIKKDIDVVTGLDELRRAAILRRWSQSLVK